MAARNDSVLYYGKVQKVGADGSSLHRGLFVTQTALLVCFPAGGVTRTISLSALQEAAFSHDNLRHRCSMRVKSEQPLIVDFATQKEVDAFVDALTQVAGHVRILRGSEFSAERGKDSVDTLPPHTQETLPRRGVRFVDPPVIASSNASNIGVRHRTSSPSVASSQPLVPNTFESHPRDSKLLAPPQKSSPQRLQRENQKEEAAEGHLLQEQFEQHMSPFRREMHTHTFGSPDKSSSFYSKDPTRPLTTQKRPNGSDNAITNRQSPQRDSSSDVRDAHSTTDSTAREYFLTELGKKENIIVQLRGELQERNDFIDDLKTALRSQEGAFQEMLSATERLRHAEAGRAELERQVQSLRAEVQRLERTLQERDEAHRSELAAKLTELQETHTTEVTAVRDAFAQYDQQMSAYVEKITTEHEREGRKWQNDQRLARKMFEQQREEIAELTDALAGTRHVSARNKSSRHNSSADAFVKEEQSQRVQSGGGSRSRRRAATPHAALSTPALEERLAALEETNARDRMREKLNRYAKSRSRPQTLLGRSDYDSEFSDVYGKDLGHAHDYNDKIAGEERYERLDLERPSGFRTSGGLMSPHVSRDAKTPSSISTPVGKSRAIRNRGLL